MRARRERAPRQPPARLLLTDILSWAVSSFGRMGRVCAGPQRAADRQDDCCVVFRLYALSSRHPTILASIGVGLLSETPFTKQDKWNLRPVCASGTPEIRPEGKPYLFNPRSMTVEQCWDLFFKLAGRQVDSDERGQMAINIEGINRMLAREDST